MRVRALSPAAPPTLPAALYFPYAAASFGAGGTRRRTIEDMAELHMSGDEVAKDFAAVLEKVVRRQGFDVVVERDRQPVAVLRPAPPPRRKISEVLALMSKNSTATMEADFARDVLIAIDSHREPLEPPA